MRVSISEFRGKMGKYMRELPVELTSNGYVVAVVSAAGTKLETLEGGKPEEHVDNTTEVVDTSMDKMCKCGRFEAESDGTCLRCKRDK